MEAWRSRGSGGERTGRGSTRSSGQRNDLVDVLVRGHFVGSLVIAVRLANLQLQLQRDVVQLRRVGNLQNASGMADRGQLLVADFLRRRVGVAQVQASENLLACGVRRGQNVELAFQIRAGGVLGGLHFRSFHHDVVPACGKCVLSTGIRGNC